MLRTGSVLVDKYLIEERISQGGTSIVFKAYHSILKLTVAIKKLDINSKVLFDFGHEVDILKRLQHRMLPRVYDVVRHGQESYIVMDHIAGESLEQIMQRKKHLKEKTVLELALDLTQVLSYIHSKNIVHSDIKPANIMITNEGEVKLIDFGLACYIQEKPWGRSVGFSAPEQMNRQAVDQRADIYSLAATLFYLLTGQTANLEKPQQEMLQKASKGLANIIQKCLSPNPKKRYQNTATLYGDLQKICRKNFGFVRKLNYKAIALCLYLLFGVCIGLGVFMNYRDTALAYQQKIELGMKLEQNNSLHAAQQLYYGALEIDKKNARAYYLIANYLFKQQNYTECIAFTETSLTSSLRKSLNYARLVSLLADSYLMLNNNEQAYNNYKDALRYHCNDVTLYHKFAIVAEKLSRNDQAKNALAKALKLNTETGLTKLLLGELAMLNESYDEAKAAFQEAIISINDDRLKLRAYLQLAEAYRINPQEIDQEIDTLIRAMQVGVIGKQWLVLEQLANACYHKAIAEQDTAYLVKACSYLEQLAFSHVTDFQVLDNLCILYQQLAQYNKAELILEEMKNCLGSDYRIIKRECFLEIVKQAKLPQAKRNYKYLLNTYQQLIKEVNNVGAVEDIELSILELKIAEIRAELK